MPSVFFCGVNKFGVPNAWEGVPSFERLAWHFPMRRQIFLLSASCKRTGFACYIVRTKLTRLDYCTRAAAVPYDVLTCRATLVAPRATCMQLPR